MSEGDSLWKPVRRDHIEEARKTDRMHIGLASGLLVVSVGTAASLDALSAGLAVLLTATIALAMLALVTGLVHLLILEKYLGHFAQGLVYSEAMADSPNAHEELYKKWKEAVDKMPKESTLRCWRRWKLALGLAGLVSYSSFGVWLAFV